MAWTDYSTQEIGRPFQGSIDWFPENGYGTGLIKTQNAGDTGARSVTSISSNGTNIFVQAARSVSSLVEVARMDTGDVNKYYRGIDSVYISKGTTSNIDYTFHLEYIPMAASTGILTQNLTFPDTLLDLLTDRMSSGTVHSLCFIVGANTSMSTKSYYKLTGCKCKNVEISGSEGEAWKVSADFSVADIATSATHPGSAATDGHKPDGYPLTFNVGGDITDGTNSFAYVTKSFSVTINHNLQDLWTIGSQSKTNCIEGAMDITGTMDISLDDGGAVHFQDVLDSETETTVQIDLGDSNLGGYAWVPRLSLTNVQFDSSSIDVSPGSEGMMESAPFTARQISVTTL